MNRYYDYRMFFFLLSFFFVLFYRDETDDVHQKLNRSTFYIHYRYIHANTKIDGRLSFMV